MLAKAEKYAAMKRGDFSGLTARELEDGVLDVSQHVIASSRKYDRWQDGEDVDDSRDLPDVLHVSVRSGWGAAHHRILYSRWSMWTKWEGPD